MVCLVRNVRQATSGTSVALALEGARGAAAMVIQSHVMQQQETALGAGTTLLETTARGVLMDFMVMQLGAHLRTVSHVHVRTHRHPTSFLQLAFWTLTTSQHAMPALLVTQDETASSAQVATLATLFSWEVAVNLQEEPEASL